jgi:abortive infection bacteriophage resistance protein
VEYAKPHLPYDKQLELITSRGMTYADRRVASQALKRIGYYRLSAYTYVFRKPGPPLPNGDHGPRSDNFVCGATLDDAIALHNFDRDLRAVLLEGLHIIEVGLRVRIGYTLGKTDRFGHLTSAALDPTACAARRNRRDGSECTAFDKWLEHYNGLVEEAKSEVYVQHFHTKYDSKIPVWVATEFMTFGALLWLYELLNDADANKIAADLGIRERGLFHRYLKALNVLRNHCSHNARVWNRATTYPPAKPPRHITPEAIHHLKDADNDKVYFLAALCAHLIPAIEPTSNWPRRFATVAKKFPAPHGMTVENMMGFPSRWTSLPLWNYEPPKAK